MPSFNERISYKRVFQPQGLGIIFGLGKNRTNEQLRRRFNEQSQPGRQVGFAPDQPREFNSFFDYKATDDYANLIGSYGKETGNNIAVYAYLSYVASKRPLTKTELQDRGEALRSAQLGLVRIDKQLNPDNYLPIKHLKEKPVDLFPASFERPNFSQEMFPASFERPLFSREVRKRK